MPEYTTEQLLCLHCKEAHVTGSRECELQLRGEMLIRIQNTEKIDLMRARQILEHNNEYCETVKEQFPTHFDCTLAEEDKRKFTPRLLKKCLANCLGTKPVSIQSRNTVTFTSKVNRVQQARCIKSITGVNGISV